LSVVFEDIRRGKKKQINKKRERETAKNTARETSH
jgi:hypothetical protein